MPYYLYMFAMPGKPEESPEEPTLTDRLNKYLLCAYLNRLNEEDDELQTRETAANGTSSSDTEERAYSD